MPRIHFSKYYIWIQYFLLVLYTFVQKGHICAPSGYSFGLSLSIPDLVKVFVPLMSLSFGLLLFILVITQLSLALIWLGVYLKGLLIEPVHVSFNYINVGVILLEHMDMSRIIELPITTDLIWAFLFTERVLRCAIHKFIINKGSLRFIWHQVFEILELLLGVQLLKLFTIRVPGLIHSNSISLSSTVIKFFKSWLRQILKRFSVWLSLDGFNYFLLILDFFLLIAI